MGAAASPLSQGASHGIRIDGAKYFNIIDQQAEEMFELLVKQMAEREGVTEQLKAADQMGWVRRMNNIRNRAAEITTSELIYA